jgi:hypothetical protein
VTNASATSKRCTVPHGNTRRRGIVGVAVAAASGLALVGAADHAVGVHVSLAPLYAVVVVFIAWRSTWPVALLAALACGVAATLSDHLETVGMLGTGGACPRPGAATWWTALVRLSAFTLVAGTVSTFRAALHEREAAVLRLEQALSQIRTLEGLLPICAWCKRIRDEEHDGEWVVMEQYISARTPAQFTHGICPSCAEQSRQT